MAQDALALMGGIDDARANPQGVLILREYRNQDVRSNVTDGPSHTRVVFTLDLTTADGLFSAGNFLIHPHDLVLATESPVNSATTVLGILGSVLSIAK
jgi:polysaccharide export outer membrane protein